MALNGSIKIMNSAFILPAPGFSCPYFGGSTKRFQTFIASANCTRVTTVRVQVSNVTWPRLPSPEPELRAELYATQGGGPSGAPLAVGYFRQIADSFEIVEAHLTPVTIVPGKEYAIVLSVANPLKNRNTYQWHAAPVYDNLHFGIWDGTSWIVEPGLGNGWMVLDIIDGDSVIEVVHNGSDGNAFGQQLDQIKRFQTFLSDAFPSYYAEPIVGVDVKVRKLPGNDHSDITVDLYEVYGPPGGLPHGVPLASAAIPATSVGYQWTIINAPLYYAQMEAGKAYAVVLSQRLPGRAPYEWAVGPANEAVAFGKWNGSSWIDESTLGDGWLKVRTMPQAVVNGSIEVTHSSASGNGFGNSRDEIKRYQTFSLSQSATIVGIDLKVRKFRERVILPPHRRYVYSDITAALYRTEQGRPTILVASAILRSLHVDYDWTIVHLPIKSHSLSPGEYAIILSQHSLSPARYEWAVGQVPGDHKFGKWNGFSWVDETSLGNGWMRVWTTYPDTDVDISHSATTGNGFGNDGGEVRRFQTFIPPVAPCEFCNVSNIEVELRKYNGTDQNDVLVELYETAGGKPAGLPKATAVIPASSIGNDWSILSVPLSYVSGVDYLISSKEYAIVLSQRDPRDAHYQWAVGKIAGSSFRFGKWDGLTWVDESGLGHGWLKISLVKWSLN